MPTRTKSFPGWPIFGEEEKKAVCDVIDSGKWWYGEKIAEFEKKFADFQGAKYAVTTCNGTIGLEIALIVCGIGAGDEVIVPAYTFIATASSVLKANAIPVFADISEKTLCISPESIEKLVTKKTKSIIPVHIAGQPADMDRIMEIAAKHNLKVIEDAAQAWSAQWHNRGVGAIGDIGEFSFQASKNLNAGEGGILLTNNAELAEAARSYTNCGRGKGKGWYEHYILAGNYRMTEFQAAILLVQLTRFEELENIRRENAEYLNKKLSQIDGIQTIHTDPRVTKRPYHIYIFKYLENKFCGIPRELFLKALEAEGIPARSGYPFPLYENPLFQKKGEGPGFCPLSCPYYGKEIDFSNSSCPVTERISKKEAVWLRQEMLLGTKEDMDDIVGAIKKIRENAKDIKGG